MSFLYHLISDRFRFEQPLFEVACQAEASGVDYFQLREKDLSRTDLLEVADSIRGTLSQTRFIVNGALDVAVSVGADGVHLQKGNIPVSAVRKKYPLWVIGYSAHSREELKWAEDEGASYAFLSPVFPTTSKVSFHPPLGMDRFKSWIQGVKIPVFGLGGFTPENARDLIDSGCAGLAGISFFVEQRKFHFRRMKTDA